MIVTDRRPRRWLPRSSPREARQDAWLIVGFLLVGVILPLAVSAIAGSLDIPRNDDWSYRRISLDLATNGRLALDGASQTMIVGQILLAQPFLWLSGLQPWGFTVAGVLFATGAMVSTYALARQVLPARLAVVPVLLLVIFPGYLAYATSFMSDVPALVGEFACLTLGARALSQRPVPTSWLLASVVVGFLAFSIRDFAIAAPASVLLAALCAEPGRRRLWAIPLVMAAACVALYLWRSTLSGQLGDVGPRPYAPYGVVLAVASMTFVLAPAAIVAAYRWRRSWRRFDVITGAWVGLAFVVLHAFQWITSGTTPQVFLNNLMSPWGVPAADYMNGGRPTLFSDPIWAAINIVSLATLVITFAVGCGIAGYYLRHRPLSISESIKGIGSPIGIVFLFAVSTVAGLLVFSFRFVLHDRYLWTVIPPISILFLYLPTDLRVAWPSPARQGGRRYLAISAAAISAVLAGMAVIYLLNSHAFDVARWRGGEALARIGVARDEIDAGYEWMGYYSTVVANVAQPAPNADLWYRGWWPSFVQCGLVSSEPSTATGVPVGGVPYDLYLVTGPTQMLYLYQMTGADCESTGVRDRPPRWVQIHEMPDMTSG